MKDRRTFLKGAATGALVLGSKSRLARAVGRTASPSKSVVVVARDAALHDSAGSLDEKRVGPLLDRALAAYTGQHDPVAAWKHILGSARVIGLKTNGLGGKGISTHAALVYAIAERLQKAGIQPGNIIVWDRNARDLQACGLTISTDMNRVRCYGSDVAGFEDKPQSWGTARIRISKILTHECDMVIGVPILKDHSMAGVTFAMKNMYGVVDRPQDLHASGCCPAVADLNCIPVIRDKVRFTIGDAMSSVYDGGPGFRPEHLWYPNALIVGEDRVAIDHTAWGMIEKKRAAAGLKTLEQSGRSPRYIAVAADATHALGTDDPMRIQTKEV